MTNSSQRDKIVNNVVNKCNIWFYKESTCKSNHWESHNAKKCYTYIASKSFKFAWLEIYFLFKNNNVILKKNNAH